MKTFITALSLSFFLAAFAQPRDIPLKKMPVQKSGITCGHFNSQVVKPLELAQPFIAFSADEYFRAQIIQPNIFWDIQRFGCGLSNFQAQNYWESLGPRPLYQDLPFVHTLTGAVFTFDYLRLSVR